MGCATTMAQDRAYRNGSAFIFTITHNRALDQYPVLQGWLEQNKTDGSVLLRWGSNSNSSNSNDSSTSSKHSSNFTFTAAERKGNSVPSIWSTWQLWWQGALPDVSGGRLAGAKVGLETAMLCRNKGSRPIAAGVAAATAGGSCCRTPPARDRR